MRPNTLPINRLLRPQQSWILLLLLTFLGLPKLALADVVKPALIEIHAYQEGKVLIEMRLSLEAVLTGINADYKNTTEAPQAKAYDSLRASTAAQLRTSFNHFSQNFITQLKLSNQNTGVTLHLHKLKVPPPGYTQVPRISTVYLAGALPKNSEQLTWHYPRQFGNAAVRLRQINKAEQQWHWSEWKWLRKNETIATFVLNIASPSHTFADVLKQYSVIGFEHILPKGLDHILFILGLFLFSTQWRLLAWQITMFTLAHTLTLGLASLGYIELPARVVEPLIALSIVYVGIENLWARHLAKHRLALIFGFGLLHGLGFASILSAFNLPKNAFIESLISFNIGVELGQITVVVAAYLLTASWLSERRFHRLVRIPASLAITLIALFWFVQRLQISVI